MLSLILLSAMFFATRGQGDDLKLVDEFDPRQGCETLEMRLDSFFTAITETSATIGYVVIKKGDNPVDNAFVYRKALHHAGFRNFPLGRYAVVATDGGSEIRVELWIGTNAKKPEVRTAALSFAVPTGQLRVPFVEETIQIVNIDNKSTYVTGGNPSCLFLLDSSIARDFLKANTEYELELLIRTKSANRFREVQKVLQNEFTSGGVPLERMRFFYVGTDDSLEGGGAKLASVKTSFVKRSPAR
jgi:hypothetical protein